MYIYFIWELLIFLDIKVCGFNSGCIYGTVIASWSDMYTYVILTFGQQVFRVKSTCGAAAQNRNTCCL